MPTSSVTRHWPSSEYAERFFALESEYTNRALRQLSGPNVLLLGELIETTKLLDLDFPNLVCVSSQADEDAEKFSVAADGAYLPFAEGSFASVLLPHVLERHSAPHQVLREAHRVLQAEGQLLLTCFNPVSFIGLQRSLRLRAAPRGQYYSLKRVKDWLTLLGFEVHGSAMYHYAPLSKMPLLANNLKFLHAIGDRWLPLFGGAFLIIARKREGGLRLVGKTQFSMRRSVRPLAPAPARKSSSIKTTCQR